MDMGALRSWVKEHNEEAILIVRRYRTLVDEKEVPVHEYRLLTPYGDMDYTTYAVIPDSEVLADEEAARKKAFARIAWESKRDTRRSMDLDRAYENGKQFMKDAT